MADSKIGWAKALKETVALVFSGQLPKYDFSKVRPAGAPLKTFGGRASGPDPLEKMLKGRYGCHQECFRWKINLNSMP